MSRSFRSGIDVANQPITSVASPANPTDAANKSYVDSLVNGQAWKAPVDAATTTAGTLATSFAAGQVIDGVTLAAGNRILVMNQATPSENGIYTVQASGAPTRSVDASTSAELNAATLVVLAGTVNKDKTFTQTTVNPVIDTDSLVFVQAGGGNTYVAGNGLSLSGSTFAVSPKAGGGVIADGTGVYVDATYAGLAKRYATTLAAGQTLVTHNLGTLDVHVQVQDISGAHPVVVDCDITMTDVNDVTLGFAVAPVANQYRVVVIA